jgi:dienelactone hydrolase
MGRHIIGYEVQKVLAAVDYFASRNQAGVDKKIAIGIAGYGEGGLVALYSAAVDERVTAALVSGYFQQREKVWQEPVYRNVWALAN